MVLGLDSSAHAAGSLRAVRVFVALKIAPDTAQELAQMARHLEEFSVRQIAAEDIHLTLVPPWNEPSIAGAAAKLRGVTGHHHAFTLAFRHIGYGPDPKRPRLLWVACAADRQLADLHDALLAAYGQREERPFLPHVTLARIRVNGRRIARQCPIDRDLTLVQRVESVELMQSPLPGERGYTVLTSAALSEQTRLP